MAVFPTGGWLHDRGSSGRRQPIATPAMTTGYLPDHFAAESAAWLRGRADLTKLGHQQGQSRYCLAAIKPAPSAPRSPPTRQRCLMNVPSCNSATACCSSACVFMTIGPYQATGSSSGVPGDQQKADALVARLHRHLVAGVEQDQRAVAGLLAAPAPPGRRSPSRSARRAGPTRRGSCPSPRRRRRRRCA